MHITPVNGSDGIIPAGTLYTWSAPVGAGFTGGASQGTPFAEIFGTLTETTNAAVTATYTVIPTSASCTGGAFTLIVNLNPIPAINAISRTRCSGVSFAIIPTNITNGIVPTGTTYSWAAPSVTGGLTGGLSGTGFANIFGVLTNPTSGAQSATYFVTPSNAVCGAGAVFTVTINVNPVAAIAAMTGTTCTGVTFNITPTDVVNGIVPSNTTYQWLAPTGSGFNGGQGQFSPLSNITGNLVNTLSYAATASYIVTPTSGACTGLSFTLVVSVEPGASVNALTTTTCTGVAFGITPTNGINGVIPSGTLYTWSAPTGSGFTGGVSQTIPNSSVYGTLVNTTGSPVTATYIVLPSTPCGLSSSFTVIVTINPIATPTDFSATALGGVPFSFSPTDGINGNVPVGTLFTWPLPTLDGGLTGGGAGTNVPSVSDVSSNCYWRCYWRRCWNSLNFYYRNSG